MAAPCFRSAALAHRHAGYHPQMSRISAAKALVAWLNSEGAETAHVQCCAGDDGEMGLHAATELKSGAELFRCPSSVAITAEVASTDVAIGALRDVDDEHRVLLFLLQQRYLGKDSRWHAYIDSLPDESALLPRIPAFWPNDERDALLRGTPICAQARATYASLCDFHEVVVTRELVARNPARFPAEAFSLSRLCWAHAIWSSRAIRLPLPGGPRPSLVPLLDMMNHSAGLPTTVSHAHPGATSAGANPLSCASFVVHAGRASPKGEELHLNYGAKGNGELLRDHGFVLADNHADVYELDLSGLCTSRAVVEDRLRLVRGQGRGSSGSGAARSFLFRGGGLPPKLLPTARVLCAKDGDELRDAVAAFAAFAIGSEGGEGSEDDEGGKGVCSPNERRGGGGFKSRVPIEPLS